ncbi:unnamed protein product [Gongylonema pulchrum]|uniref:Uncharacterized protein n=1 Tax=Gongylonema pulchrum TaxID=637853 RepID=A0A183DG65_9BILA|nr:unnamed protein product [Gongylonema pulchrum]
MKDGNRVDSARIAENVSGTKPPPVEVQRSMPLSKYATKSSGGSTLSSGARLHAPDKPREYDRAQCCVGAFCARCQLPLHRSLRGIHGASRRPSFSASLPSVFVHLFLPHSQFQANCITRCR